MVFNTSRSKTPNFSRWKNRLWKNFVHYFMTRWPVKTLREHWMKFLDLHISSNFIISFSGVFSHFTFVFVLTFCCLLHWFRKLFRIFMAIDLMTKDEICEMASYCSILWLWNRSPECRGVFSKDFQQMHLLPRIAMIHSILLLRRNAPTQAMHVLFQWWTLGISARNFRVNGKCWVTIWNCFLVFLHDIATFRSVIKARPRNNWRE